MIRSQVLGKNTSEGRDMQEPWSGHHRGWTLLVARLETKPAGVNQARLH